MKALILAFSLAAIVACDSESVSMNKPDTMAMLGDPDDHTPIPPPSIEMLSLQFAIHNTVPGPLPCVELAGDPCTGAATPDRQRFHVYADNGESFGVEQTSQITDLGNATIVGTADSDARFVYRLSVGASTGQVDLATVADGVHSYGSLIPVDARNSVRVSPSQQYPAPIVELHAADPVCTLDADAGCLLDVVTQHYSADFYQRYSAYIVSHVGDGYRVHPQPIDLAHSFYAQTSVAIGRVAPDSEPWPDTITVRLVVTDQILDGTVQYERLHEIPGAAYVSPPLPISIGRTLADGHSDE